MQLSDPTSENIEKKATRDGYGDALLELGAENEKVVVLEADLSGSTKTKPFSQKFPDRFFNFGVAEQNLVGHAAGMSRTGLIPFASSFAMFLTGRAWEVVRNTVVYAGENVKLVATHAGITLGEDGASHQTIEDIAIMRVIPEMTVVVPADYSQAFSAVKAAATYEGPIYIRLGRPGIPVIYNKDEKFEIGKGHVIQEGDKDTKIAFVSTGIMVYESWKAARILEKETGKRPYVVNMPTIKPLDENLLKDLASKVDIIYTFEEHNIIGGLGSAVSEYLCEFGNVRVKRIGIEDKFGQSGTVRILMQEYGLTAEKIVSRLKKEF